MKKKEWEMWLHEETGMIHHNRFPVGPDKLVRLVNAEYVQAIEEELFFLKSSVESAIKNLECDEECQCCCNNKAVFNELIENLSH